MLKCQCRKCARIWYGWARNNICPQCGGEIIQIKRNDHTRNEAVNKETGAEISNPRF